MTIIEAVKTVMAKKKSAMTIAEIYEAITAGGYFEFRTANAAHVVSTQVRRHTSGLPPTGGRKVFKLDGPGKYQLIQE